MEKVLVENSDYKYVLNDTGTVAVFKNKGQWVHTYTVGVDRNEMLYCSCPGYKFHNRQCKHIEEVAEYLQVNKMDLMNEALSNHVDKLFLYRETEAWLHIGWVKFEDKVEAKKWIDPLKEMLPLHPINENFDLQTIEEMKLTYAFLEDKVTELERKLNERIHSSSN